MLVDASNADDAGVYRITDDIAVVLTTDYFTPIVDDAYWFGAIAAANSLSDVYAMGGKPVVALNVAMFPEKSEFFPTIKKILPGGLLIFIPGEKKDTLVTALQKEGILAAYIGDVFSESIKDSKRIFVG